MACRACKREHSPLVRCEVAARIAAVVDVADAKPVTDGVTDVRELSAAVERMRKWRAKHPELTKERDREAARRYRERRRAAARAGFQKEVT